MFGDPVTADLAEVAFLHTSLPREEVERDRDADTDTDHYPYGHAEVPFRLARRDLFSLTPRQVRAVLDAGSNEGWSRLAQKPRPPEPQESGDATVALRRRPAKDDAAAAG
jgi:hypothetical protein